MFADFFSVKVFVWASILKILKTTRNFTHDWVLYVCRTGKILILDVLGGGDLHIPNSTKKNIKDITILLNGKKNFILIYFYLLVCFGVTLVPVYILHKSD